MYPDPTSNRQFVRSSIIRLAFIVLAVIALLTVRPLVLQTTHVVQLKPSVLFTSQVAQAFSTTPGQSLPVPGKDFQLTNIHYFQNKQWVVATIKPLTNYVGDGGMVVLQMQHGIYNVVLGPGTVFSMSTLKYMPNDVSLYIIQNGATDESI